MLCICPLPDHWQIVFCNFPDDPTKLAPGRNPHPCLVVDIYDPDPARPDLPGRVGLVPGTSQGPAGSAKVRAISASEMDVSPSPGTGLSRTTRFKFSQVLAIPFEDHYFACSGVRPVHAGKLPDSLVAAAITAENAAATVIPTAKPIVQIRKKFGWQPKKPNDSGQSTDD